MKIKLLSLAILTFSASSYADYHVSTSIDHHMSETKRDSDFGTSKNEIDLTTIDAQIYFSGVDTSYGAIRESGFLSKSSSMYIVGRRFSSKFTFQPSDDRFDGDSESSNNYAEKLGGYGVINDRVFIGGSLENYQGDSLVLELESGAYIGDAALITGVLARVVDEDDESDESDDTLIGVRYHQVFMPENSFSVATKAGLLMVDDARSTNFELGFYFSQYQGLSLSYEGYYDDEDDFTFHYDNFGLAYHVYFNENFGIELKASHGDKYSFDKKDTSYGLALNLNF